MDLIKKLMSRHGSLLRQLFVFGVVGVCVASIHFSIVIFIVESGWMSPLRANMIAFLIAFQVSYWGHRSWTFAGTDALHRIAFPRLFVVACTSFATNQSLYYFFLTVMKLPYILALLVVLSIVPIITFTLSKLWVFR